MGTGDVCRRVREQRPEGSGDSLRPGGREARLLLEGGRRGRDLWQQRAAWRRRRRAAAGGGRRRRLLWAPRRPPPVDVDPASRAPCVDDNNVASVGAFGGRQGEVPGRGGEEGAEEEGEEGGEEERRRREAALLPTRHPPFSFSKKNRWSLLLRFVVLSCSRIGASFLGERDASVLR